MQLAEERRLLCAGENADLDLPRRELRAELFVRIVWMLRHRLLWRSHRPNALSLLALVARRKEDIERPNELVDVTRLQLKEIKPARGGVSIGALATNTETANNALIRANYPLLTQAIVAGASAQLRNMATNGGNLLQRTRCLYFYDIQMPCNKREPGTGCGALQGINRIHAIFGWSDQCVATYPGDMANALYALDAVVRVRNASGGERTIPIDRFHRLPGDTPQIDTNLEHGELIVAIELPRSNFAKHSYYLKVRDRASYAFALVAVAAALELDGNAIKQARVVLVSLTNRGAAARPKPY